MTSNSLQGQLSDERERQGVTKAAVAAYCGVTAPAVSLWDSGKRVIPADRADAYAQLLGMRWQLVDDDQGEEP